MTSTLVKSKLHPTPIPFQYLIPRSAFNAIRNACHEEATKLAAKWARFAQLQIDVLELRREGIEPAPCQCWVEDYRRKGVDYARVRSMTGPVFGGAYAMELGEKSSAEAKGWALRIELANKLRELERIKP